MYERVRYASIHFSQTDFFYKTEDVMLSKFTMTLFHLRVEKISILSKRCRNIFIHLCNQLSSLTVMWDDAEPGKTITSNDQGCQLYRFFSRLPNDIIVTEMLTNFTVILMITNNIMNNNVITFWNIRGIPVKTDMTFSGSRESFVHTNLK